MPLVEKRYAEALVDISAIGNAIEQYQKDFGIIAKTYEEDEDFRSFLLNPEIGTDIKKNVIQDIFSGTRMEVINFIMLLLDKTRIKYLPGIYSEFVRLADEKRNILHIRIVSAVPVDDAQVAEISEKFRILYGASYAKISLELDADLIGGVKVIIGDKVIDGTVKGKLKSLEEMLIKG